jgi:hypothetical protein
MTITPTTVPEPAGARLRRHGSWVPQKTGAFCPTNPDGSPNPFPLRRRGP